MKPEPSTKELIIEACEEHKEALLLMAELSDQEELLKRKKDAAHKNLSLAREKLGGIKFDFAGHLIK